MTLQKTEIIPSILVLKRKDIVGKRIDLANVLADLGHIMDHIRKSIYFGAVPLPHNLKKRVYAVYQHVIVIFLAMEL